jgi:hypothetical protein
MPLGWTIAAVQLGCFAVLLVEWLGMPGLILTGLIGALNLPFCERMAEEDKLWIYVNCLSIWRTPYYVIFGEFLGAVLIGAGAMFAQRGSLMFSAAVGAVVGLCLLLTSMLSYFLIEVAIRRLLGKPRPGPAPSSPPATPL